MINQDIYKPKYKYTVGNYDYFTTTDTIPNILSDNELWQRDAVWDNSNVFATYNPLNDYVLGSVVSNFNANFNKDDQKSNVGLQKFTTDKSSPVKVNLRYAFAESISGNTGCGHGYRWTGYDAELYDNFLKTIAGQSNQIDYNDINYDVIDYAVNFTSGYQLDNVADKLIIDLNRDNLFFSIYIDFNYIDNGSLRGINIDKDKLIEWLKNDNTGFIDVDGKQCFVAQVTAKMFGKQESGSTYAFRQIGTYTRQDLDTQDTTVIQGMGSLYLICERYINNNIYYFTFPIGNSPTNSGTQCYINMPYKNGINFKNNCSFQSASGNSVNPYTAVGTLAFTNGTSDDTFNNGFALYPYDNMDNTPLSDDFFNDYDGTTTYKIDGKNIISKNYGGYSTGAYSFRLYKYCFSGRELMSIFASTLIPFYIDTTSVTVISSTTDNDLTFIGIRDDDGNVSGKYTNYIWGQTTTEKDFRPDDFEPFDPIIPDPEDPDTDKDGADSGTVSPAGKVTIGATNGFVTYYALTASQIRAIGKSLWGNTDQKEVLKNFFMFDFDQSDTNYELSYASILDYFVGLKYFPFNIREWADTQDTGEMGIRVGTGATLIDAGVLLSGTTIITNPIAVLDGGTCRVPPYYGSFMDSEPIAVASLYVPFCGTTEVLLSAITDKPLTLTYYVDMVTGCCIAIVQATSTDGVYPVAELTGVMGFDMMLTGNNHNQQLSSIMSSLKHTALGSLGSITSAAIGVANKDPLQALAGIAGAANNIANTAIDMPQTAALHPITAGTSSSLASLASYQIAFIQIKRKNSITPSNYASTIGYIANQTKSIGSISGYTQVVNPNLSGIPATADELTMIRDLLTSGFYA